MKAPHGVGEWAKHSVNVQLGCDHNCHYCYAKCMAVRFGRATPKSWAEPKILPKKVSAGQRKKHGRIMFPTSHDITPANLSYSLMVLRKMLGAGNEVLIVSKPHLKCIRAICRELAPWREQILFRFTVGSANERTLRFWEPGAPAFRERLRSLRHAHGQGFATSVSCEPMLDTAIDTVIEAVRPYVTDAVWLGRANRLRQNLAINCPNNGVVVAAADRMLAEQSDEWIWGLYRRYRRDPIVKWKDSIKKVVGLERPKETGLDI